MLRLSLLKILSRSEIPYAICDYCSCRTKVHWLQINCFTKTTYIYKDLTELHTHNICVRDSPVGTELRTCLCFEYKTVTALPVRWLKRECVYKTWQKIHFPVPKYLCKQGTTNVLNTYLAYNLRYPSFFRSNSLNSYASNMREFMSQNLWIINHRSDRSGCYFQKVYSK